MKNLIIYYSYERNTEELVKGNNIVSKLDLIYPIKNGIEEAKNKVNNWIKNNLK